ncbi:AAA family ATPase [Maliponia aquimaris]|uniref:Chromosome segregation protein n=1 Tax=Maliponia aquimaris TaxID=1673631 RepID=A0A238KP50_9RHOB|nr:chromosome segregation protein SMC [Maliponia aquimaris]SMX44609.1 chromosome segregation protein [Maliponia aquimaris]
MKLRRIAVNNLRRFTRPVEIAGLSDGLNVLSAPNEQGKSTLFDGLQALFFIAHGGQPREIKSLQPHAKGAPEVQAEVETAEGTFTVTKRWLQKPRATVHRDGRLVAQADEAEAWISRLAAADAGGPAGLLWVRQGITALGQGTKKEMDSQLEARRDLLSSVTGEVEAMTGGARMDAALKRCREELATYATGTGRPKVGGPWKDAEIRVETLRAERDTLARTAEELHEALTARKRARAELAEVANPEAEERRKSRLAEATAAHAAAERHADQLEQLTRATDTARLRLDALTRQRADLAAARAERAEAQARLQEAQASRTQAETDQAKAEQATQAATTALAEARAALTTADARLRSAEQARRLRESAARRADLTDRLQQAQTLAATLATRTREARQGPTTRELQALDRLAADLDRAKALRDAAAAHLRIAYDPGRDGAITAEGQPVQGDRDLPLLTDTTLRLDGIGTLTLRPGGALDDSAVSRAQEALDTALRKHDLPTLDAARAAAETRASAERAAAEAKAALTALAPQGLDALHEALAALPDPQETGDAPDLDTAESERAQAEEARVSAEARLEALRDRLQAARTTLARAQADTQAATDRLTRADSALSRLSDVPEDELARQETEARAALDKATAARDAAARDAPDLETTGAALARAQSADRAAAEAIARLRPEIARLDERISRGSEGAVEERLAEVTEQLRAAERTLSRITRDVAVLQRLQSVLEAARTAARDRYFSPVANALRPLLHLLWPEAQLDWDDGALLPRHLLRQGEVEPIDILSGGTQEQLALLVRLAFARLLAQDGRAAPVILDDALVYTDDDRIERMFDALHRQAADVQILVLTCRQRAFRDLGGTQLQIRPLTGRDSLMDA